jgi:histidine triad (HIT) family protein
MNCLFCKLVAGQIPARIALDEPDVLAFHDIHPVAPTHVLVIPKKHIASLADATDDDTLLLGRLLTAARTVAEKLELRGGFRTVINTGEHGGQTVHHIHVHVLGGRHHTWPPG